MTPQHRININVLLVDDDLNSPLIKRLNAPGLEAEWIEPSTDKIYFDPLLSEADSIRRPALPILNAALATPGFFDDFDVIVVSAELSGPPTHPSFPWGVEFLRQLRYEAVSTFSGRIVLITWGSGARYTGSPPGLYQKDRVGNLLDLDPKRIEMIRRPISSQDLAFHLLQASPPRRSLRRPGGVLPRLSPSLKWSILFIDDEVPENNDSEGMIIRSRESIRELFQDTATEAHSLSSVLSQLTPEFLPHDDRGALFLRGQEFVRKFLAPFHEDNETVPGLDLGPIHDKDDCDALDCVFIDVLFGRESYDIRLLRKLEALHPDLPVFVLSAAAESAEMGGHGTERNEFYYPTRAMELGARGYFSKLSIVERQRGPACFVGVVRSLAGGDWKREYFECLLDSPEVIQDSTGTLEGLQRDRKNEQYLAYLYILRKLFIGAESLEILRCPGAGFTETHKFFVRARRHHVRESVKLVKIGLHFTMSDEKASYDRIIDGRLDHFIGRVRGEWVRAGRWAGIVYTAVGRSKDYDRGGSPESLSTYLNQQVSQVLRNPQSRISICERVERTTERLFDSVLTNLYRFSQDDKKSNDIVNEYRRVLPAEQSYELDLKGKYQLDRPFESLLEDPRLRLGKRIEVYAIPVESFRQRVEASLAQALTCQQQPRPSPGESIPLIGNVAEIEQSKIKLWKREEGLWRWVELRAPQQKGRASSSGDDSLIEAVRLWEIPRIALDAERLNWPEVGIENAANPLLVIETALQKGWHLPYRRSYIHGDLNLDNILVSRRGRRVDDRDAALSSRSPQPKNNQLDSDVNLWLIDFAATREAHTAYDLVKLEIEVRTQVLAPRMFDAWRQAEWATREDRSESILSYLKWFCACEADVEKAATEQNSLVAGAEVPYSVIRRIRKEAWNELGISAGEYLFGLMCYALRAATFSNLLDPVKNPGAPLPVLLVFLVAVRAASQLGTLGYQLPGVRPTS